MPEELLKEIGRLAVQTRKQLEGQFDPDLLDLFTLVAKYMTLSYLPRTLKKKAAVVTVSRFCPLCQTRGFDNGRVTCENCVLQGDEIGGCGGSYDSIRAALLQGTPPEVALSLNKPATDLAKRVMKRMEESNVSADTTEI